jgi:hypothetical protein
MGNGGEEKGDLEEDRREDEDVEGWERYTQACKFKLFICNMYIKPTFIQDTYHSLLESSPTLRSSLSQIIHR